MNSSAALAEPAGQLQSWIAIGAHEAEATAWRSFRGDEGNDRQRSEFARERFVGALHLERFERLGAGEDFSRSDRQSGRSRFRADRSRPLDRATRHPVRRASRISLRPPPSACRRMCSLPARRAASGIESAKAGNGRSISTHVRRCTGVMTTHHFWRLRKHAPRLWKAAQQHPDMRGTAQGWSGSSSRHERRAGCMRLSAAVCRCVEGCSRLEALPSGCPVPAAGR